MDPTPAADSASVWFLLLAIVAGFGRFASFALNYGDRVDPNDEAAKKNDAFHSTEFTQRALVNLRHYLDHLFGHSPVAIVGRLTLVSAFIVLGLFWFSDVIGGDFGKVSAEPAMPVTYYGMVSRVLWMSTFLLSIVLANTVFDFFSLLATRSFMYPFTEVGMDAERRRALGWRCAALPLYILAVYLCFFATMNAVFTAIMMIRGQAAGYGIVTDFGELLRVIWDTFWMESLPRLVNPIYEGTHIEIGNANILLFCLTPLFPPMILLITFLVGVLLDFVNLASGGYLSRELLANDGQSRNGLFVAVLIITVMSGAVGVLVTPE